MGLRRGRGGTIGILYSWKPPFWYREKNIHNYDNKVEDNNSNHDPEKPVWEYLIWYGDRDWHYSPSSGPPIRYPLPFKTSLSDSIIPHFLQIYCIILSPPM